MMTVFRQTYIDALKYYYFVGGMPEAVLSFAEEKDFNEVRAIQKRILAAYEQDFSKHAPNEIVPKIRMIWNSIPSQLAKENKKFIYGLVREGGRAKDYEAAIMWQRARLEHRQGTAPLTDRWADLRQPGRRKIPLPRAGDRAWRPVISTRLAAPAAPLPTSET